MIKSLLGDDENVKKKEGMRSADASRSRAPDASKMLDIDSFQVENNEHSKEKITPQAVKPFEIGEPIGKPKPAQARVEVGEIPETPPGDVLPIISEPSIADDIKKPELQSQSNSQSPSDSFKEIAENSFTNDTINISSKAFTPDSAGETVRKTGLAWSAAIVLFGSVTFMMLLGWFVDLTIGSKPWGLVGGIILGAVIGFVQFFRTTARILNPPNSTLKKHPLFLGEDDND